MNWRKNLILENNSLNISFPEISDFVEISDSLIIIRARRKHLFHNALLNIFILSNSRMF